MKRVVYSSPFIPAEWIVAHGMAPSRIVPSGEGHPAAGLPEGVCPYARTFAADAENAPGAAAVIFATSCDQMRRMAEKTERRSDVPLFLFNLPACWNTINAQRMYASELKRLGRFLEKLGGRAPAMGLLAAMMSRYDQSRRNLRAMRPFLSPREYCEAWIAFNESGAVRSASPKPAPPEGIPIALLGGPLIKEHLVLFDLVEKAGGVVALDATETGERCLPAPFDHRMLASDPFECLMDAYFGAIPDAFRRPDTALHDWLGAAIRERGIKGILLRYYTWCDIWHAEARRIKETAGVPVVAVSCAADGSDTSHLRTRIDALIEMVR
jgi:benzoyl-CoA reductase/2-hydroxyglutaryl-CoA dehydratase subunit BcrC/BadD/HgdB